LRPHFLAGCAHYKRLVRLLERIKADLKVGLYDISDRERL